MSKYAHLAEPDPQFEEILAKLPPLPPRSKDVLVVRPRFIANVIKPKMDRLEPLLPPESEYRLQDFQVPVDGGEILVRCLTPTPGGETGTETYPLLVWYHLSGWRVANIDMDDYDMRMKCVQFKTVMVLVSYRLCPENPFPASPEDAYAGLKWAVENASKIGADPHKGLVVGGASAGGGLAAVCALRARDDPFFEGRPVTGQILDYPALVYPPAIPEKFKPELQSCGDPDCDTQFLDAAEIEVLYTDFKPIELNDIRVSPLLAPSHKNLAPAVVQICGKDPLRDEGILYEKLLRESGVQTRLHTYSGMPHGFHHGFPSLDKTKKFDQDWEEGFRWLLSMTGYSTV